MKKGTVKFFNDAKGFGFITNDDTGRDIFAHVTGLKQDIRERDKVTYDEEDGIFSTPMVQAILEGRKSQTRRILKFKWLESEPKYWVKVGEVYPGGWDEMDYGLYQDFETKDHKWMNMSRCPYGQVGDVLWVRESFSKPIICNLEERTQRNGFIYKAGFKNPELHKWKPSIHMPCTAARIFLLIKNIRVERLQEINMHDILAEGIIEPERYDDPETVKYLFKELWDKINGKRASWESNPWVWVIEFELKNVLK